MVFYFNINPVIFSVFGLEVRYYGLAYVIGFLLAFYFTKKLAQERQLPLTDEQLDSFFFWLIIGVVLSARLFYVIVYNLHYYLQNPLLIPAVWQGGLSFHGGLLGAIFVGFWFCKKHKIAFYDLADILVIPAALALVFGRIANFLNGELYGRITSVTWGVKFPGAEGFRHPSQLYASSKNLLIFAILWNIRKMNLPKGFLFWSFITLYAALRFTVEFFREADVQLGYFFGLSMGQILSLIMVGIGACVLTYQVRSNRT